MRELTAPQRKRYARHLLLPEIAEPGQMRLCQARYAPSAHADPRAAAVAADYLERAGLQPAHPEATQEAGEPAGAETPHVVRLPDPDAVAALAGAPGLEEAAAALAGAHAAVETLKAVAGTGPPADPLPPGLVGPESPEP